MVEEENEKRVRWLAKYGADLNMREWGGKTLLIRCIVAGKKNMAKLLVELGADVNKRDYQCKTPLDWAQEMEDKQMEAFLLGHGAETNGGGCWNSAKGTLWLCRD